MFFQRLSSLILVTKLLIGSITANELINIDSLSDVSSIPPVDTLNGILDPSSFSSETILADSPPWLSSTSPGHDSEELLSESTNQKACTQSRKFRKSRRDGAGGEVGVCRPQWFKPKEDPIVTDKNRDIMSMFDPKQWERVVKESLELKQRNGMFLKEDHRRCKLDPFLVHVCCDGPLGNRMLCVLPPESIMHLSMVVPVVSHSFSLHSHSLRHLRINLTL